MPFARGRVRQRFLYLYSHMGNVTLQFRARRGLFLFRKRSLPFLTVNAMMAVIP